MLKLIRRYLLGKRIENSDFILVFKQGSYFEHYTYGFTSDQIDVVFRTIKQGINQGETQLSLENILKESGIENAKD